MDNRTRTRIQKKPKKQKKITHPGWNSQRKNNKIKGHIHNAQITKGPCKVLNKTPGLLPRQNHRRTIHRHDHNLCQA